MSDEIIIQVTRDSVSAGDDIFAPHATTLRAKPDARLSSVVLSFYARYLPRVTGNGHSWTVECAGQIVARSEGNSHRPVFTAFAETVIENLSPEGPVLIHLRYHPCNR